MPARCGKNLKSVCLHIRYRHCLPRDPLGCRRGEHRVELHIKTRAALFCESIRGVRKEQPFPREADAIHLGRHALLFRIRRATSRDPTRRFRRQDRGPAFALEAQMPGLELVVVHSHQVSPSPMSFAMRGSGTIADPLGSRARRRVVEVGLVRWTVRGRKQGVLRFDLKPSMSESGDGDDGRCQRHRRIVRGLVVKTPVVVNLFAAALAVSPIPSTLSRRGRTASRSRSASKRHPPLEFRREPAALPCHSSVSSRHRSTP